MAQSYPNRRKKAGRRKARKNSKLVSTIKSVSKAVALKEAETKRVYLRHSGQIGDSNNQNTLQTHYTDLISSIPQQTAATSGFESVRIGNEVSPCWLKGFIFLSNIHHGNFDFVKNYSCRIMILKDRNNIISDPNVVPSAYPLYRVAGQAAAATGSLLDHCAPIDWRAWQPLMDKQYKLMQYSELTAGAKSPFIKIPVSINLTKCNFEFDRGNADLTKENIMLFMSFRSFDGAVHQGEAPIDFYYDLCLSFKDT